MKIYTLSMIKQLTLIQPDDWHVHWREGDALEYTINDTIQTFGRALIMPNLGKPLITVNLVNAYFEAIMSLLKKSANPYFKPWMTLYLTDATSPEEIIKAKKTGFILSAKLYPSGATTNSQAGVRSLKQLYPIFEIMQQENLVLNIHGEVIDPTCDIFYRETQFIQDELIPIIRNFPKLRITLEHISTKVAVDFIQNASENLAATITPHHLYLNRNDLLAGGIKPHYYCLPILKKKSDQDALIEAAISGNPRFFLGTDSAPHAVQHKLAPCGCAGVYNAPVALPLCADIFERTNALAKLENFSSQFGAEFYELPLNKKQITLIKEPLLIPEKLPLGKNWVVPLCAGGTLPWKIR